MSFRLAFVVSTHVCRFDSSLVVLTRVLSGIGFTGVSNRVAIYMHIDNKW